MSRLGLWIDAVYREQDGTVHTDQECFQFLRFACAVGDHFDELVLFGREVPESVPTPFALPGRRTRLAPLPYYASLRDVPGLLRALPGLARAAWRGVGRIDVMWVFGPYPFSWLFVLAALLRGKRVVLGVRQDTMEYYRRRLPHPALAGLLAPLWLLEASYRALGRAVGVTAVGREIADRYGGPRPGVLEHAVSLTPRADVADHPPERDWSGTVKLLSVGRVEPEKAPELMVDALAELDRRHPGRFALTWAGTGRLVQATEEHARRLGVEQAVHMAGYVPYGSQLEALYREAHLFVHVALTEGLPQVLLEAMSAGTPIVATDVGGVRAALDDGAAGSIVPPSDVSALVAAVEGVLDDPAGRERRVERGLELARARTLEGESARVAQFLSG